MKIYYQARVLATENFDNLDLIPEVRKIIDQYNDLSEKYNITIYEKAKYNLMWVLRSLEEEINTEGGAIKINEDFSVSFSGFSEALVQNMKSLIGINR